MDVIAALQIIIMQCMHGNNEPIILRHPNKSAQTRLIYYEVRGSLSVIRGPGFSSIGVDVINDNGLKVLSFLFPFYVF